MEKQKTIPQLEAEKEENERKLSQLQHKKQQLESKGQILRSTPNTAPLICGACNTQPEGLLTTA